MIKTYLLNNTINVIPVEHRAKFIKDFIPAGPEDIRIFSDAFHKESDPVFKKIIAIKIIEMAENYFNEKFSIVLRDKFRLHPHKLYEAIEWRLPK
jgi:hypothetical protein